ncbi:MAG: DNA polymerase III subunit chi, partial [Gammaproteobacteria bacterium]|nr:DNA polymerase III subunit chi [Gammaproteobacteria bacterium]
KVIGETSLLAKIDQALWQNFDFIPHQFNKNTSSIVVSKLFDKKPFALINLNPDSIKETASWQRIIHIITNDEQQKLAARQAYRYYQQSDLNIKTHKIKALTDEKQVST